MTTQRSLLLAAALLAIVPALPARAGQSVGEQRYLTTSFDRHTSDGTRYAFDLEASEKGTGDGLPSQLTLDLTQCKPGGSCRRLAHVRLALPDGAVTIAADLETGSLTTTVAGLHLSVRLAAQHVNPDPANLGFWNPGFGVYALETDKGGPSPRFEVDEHSEGDSSTGGRSCKTIGNLVSYQGLDRTGDEVRDPRPTTLRLPKDVLSALAHARC